MGLPNSSAEEGLLAELISGRAWRRAAELPSWSQELIGPLFRGTEAKIKSRGVAGR